MVAENNIIYCSTNLLDLFHYCFRHNVFNRMGRRLNYAFGPIKSWFYLSLWLLFIIHQLLEDLRLSNSFFRSYLDDLLVVPIVLPATLALMRLIFYRKIRCLSVFMTVSFVLLLSILFEVILPKVNALYTADLWDVFCYAIGGIVFWRYQYYICHLES